MENAIDYAFTDSVEWKGNFLIIKKTVIIQISRQNFYRQPWKNTRKQKINNWTI
ncbi:MAG TPA: hypothetical protein VD905_21215 [Flavobacteriales bacterium]|nr:hypothetical protein [Flavobacteriales bacterium]